MFKQKLTYLFAILFLAVSLPAEAQLGKMLKNKVKKAAQEAVSNDASSGDANTTKPRPSGKKSKMPGSVPRGPQASAEKATLSLQFKDIMGYSSGRSNYIVNAANYRQGEAEQGHAVVIHPDFDLDFSWLVFISPPILDAFALDGVRVYEMTSGSYVIQHPADPNHQLNLDTSGLILTRMLKLDEDVFVLYAGAFQGGHSYNVPSYVKPGDLTITNIIAPPEKLNLFSKEKAKEMALAIEAKFKANYEEAAAANLASIKIPKAGKLDANTSLKNFAKAEINKVINKDGAKLMYHRIESNDWSIVHHKITGKPLYRWIKGAFTETTRQGNCKLQGFILKQQYNGSGYSNTSFGGVIHGQMPYGQKIDCKNAQP